MGNLARNIAIAFLVAVPIATAFGLVGPSHQANAPPPAKSTSASAEIFDVKFEEAPAGKGLMLCTLGFNVQVPRKAVVDAMMEQALNLCIARDPNHDILMMAFRNDDALDETAETYQNLTYDHKTKKIEKQTLSDFIESVNRNRRR